MGCAICEDQIRCVVWCGGEDMRTAVVAMVAIHVVRCFFFFLTKRAILSHFIKKA
jgi:hypothetical protein